MIHGARGLAVLAALVVGLALAIVIEPSTTAPVERSLLVNFVEDHAVALRWTRSGTGNIDIERGRNGMWTQVANKRSTVERRTVEAVLATLRSARWHRRASAARAGAISVTLTVHTADHQARAIGIGNSMQGADQAWVVVDNRAYLVDGWVVRALNVDLLALRDRQPLGDVASGETPIRIVRGQRIVELQPQPWRDSRGIIAPDLAHRLIGALSQLQLASIPVRVPSRGPLPIERTTIALPERGLWVEVGGQCPGDSHLIHLTSRDGEGCVESERWNAVLAALVQLDQPLDHIVDRRPAAGDAATIKLPDGTIHITGRPTLEISGSIHPADASRVDELRHALAIAAAVVPRPTGPPHATIEVTLRSGARIVLSRYGTTFVRGTETIGLRSSVADVISRPIVSYIDPTRWIEDPNAITVLEITTPGGREGPGTPLGATTRTTFMRGAIIGEWIRDGHLVPADKTAVVDVLAQAVAEVRATVAVLPRQWTPVCTVIVTFAPPVGAPTTHQLDLGASGPDGCLARIDGAASFAPPALCKAAIAASASFGA